MHISKAYDIANTGWVLKATYPKHRPGYVSFDVISDTGESIIEGSIKWDGCLNMRIESIHMCGWSRDLELTIKEIYTRAAEIMERENLIAFGNLGDMEKFYNDQNK